MRYAICTFLAVLVVGCSKPADPQHALLDKFVDAYIRNANPAAAKQYASGDAVLRLDAEIAAVSGQARPSAGPDVEFKIANEQSASDTATFELELKISSAGNPAFTRDLLITTAHANGEWKVVDYLFLK